VSAVKNVSAVPNTPAIPTPVAASKTPAVPKVNSNKNIARSCKLSLGLDISWVKTNRKVFEDGFATDMAAALGCAASSIRVLSVEAGSVIVNFGVTTKTAANALGNLAQISADGGLNFKSVAKAAGKDGPMMADKIEVGKSVSDKAAKMLAEEPAKPKPVVPTKIKQLPTISIPRKLWKRAHAMVSAAPKTFLKLSFTDDISNNTDGLQGSIAQSLGVDANSVKIHAMGLDGLPTMDFSPPKSTVMSLEADFAAIASNLSDFRTAFADDMASGLNTTADKVNIYNVSAGSVIVDFQVKEMDTEALTSTLAVSPPKLAAVAQSTGTNMSVGEVVVKIHPLQIIVEVVAPEGSVEPVAVNTSAMNSQLSSAMNVSVVAVEQEESDVANFVVAAKVMDNTPEPVEAPAMNVSNVSNKSMRLNMTKSLKKRLFSHMLNISNLSNSSNATVCDLNPNFRECLKPEVPYVPIWVKKRCPMDCTGQTLNGIPMGNCVEEYVDSRDLGICNKNFNNTRHCSCNVTGNVNATYMWRPCRDVTLFTGKPELEFNGTCNCTWPWRPWYKADWTNATGCRPPTCAEKHQDCGNCSADPDCGWCENQTKWNEFNYKTGSIDLKTKTVGVCLEGKAGAPGLHPVSNWNMSQTCHNKKGFRFYPGDRETGPIKKTWRFAPFECEDIDCKAKLDCNSCLDDARCGWCSDVPKGEWELDLPKALQKKKAGVKRGGCYEAAWDRTSDGKTVINGRLAPRNMRCPKGDWNYETCAAPRCDVHGSCLRCLKDIRCGWCMTSCVHASLDGGDDRQQVCPKSEYLWNEQCPLYAPPPHFRLLRGPKKELPAGAGCQELDTADKCVKNSKCGWCGSENRCSRGDAEGRYSRDCNSWYFGITPEEACIGYKGCSTCTKDRMCGWCSATKSCQSKQSERSAVCSESWKERNMFTDGDVCIAPPVLPGKNRTVGKPPLLTK